MPKSGTQRKKEWIERNPDENKERQKVHDKNYRARLKNRLSEEQKKALQQKNSQRARRYRLKKKEEKILSEISNPPTRPQVMGKLVKRVRKALGENENQISNVLSVLIGENNSNSVSQNNTQRLSTSNKTVEDFFLSDEISRLSPNTKDFVTVTKDGKKEKLTLRHLLYSLQEVYGMFIKDYPNIKIGFSKFFNLKPANVVSFSKMPHNVCCCHIHENLRCALKTPKNTNKIFSHLLVDNSMHENFVCSIPSDDCFFNKCEFCLNAWNLHELARELGDNRQVVSWFEWTKTDKTKKRTNVYCNIEKVKKTGTIQNLIDEIADKVPEFLDHQFIKMNQARTSRKMTEEAMERDSESPMIIVDFAEKYKCIQQNAPQSAHYGQTPITIFTVAIYHRELTSMAIVSDCEKNSKEVGLAFIDFILEYLPESVKKVNFWSDNAPAQFKNQFIMEAIKYFEDRHKKKIQWNFYAPMHGKSVVDGIGGSVKRFVRQKTLAEDLQVSSAKEFAAVASRMDVKIVELSPAAINHRNNNFKLKSIIKSARSITDIKKKISFKVEDYEIGKKRMKKIISSKISI